MCFSHLQVVNKVISNEAMLADLGMCKITQATYIAMYPLQRDVKIASRTKQQ